MKIQTDHRFYAPVFKQIAGLLKDDYVMKTDHTDKELSLSFTVVHKKYKYHGLNISTYLGKNPEWTIRGYVDIPFKMNWLSKYEFTPEKDDDGFPLLSPDQLKIVEKKIKAIDKSTLKEIKDLKDDLEDDMMQIDKDTINSYFDSGFDGLEHFKVYGIQINYKEYLLNFSPKNHLKGFRILQGILNSKTPAIRNLMEEAIDMYIDEMNYMNKDDAYSAANRFMTVDRTNSILAQFTDQNRKNYLDMVKAQFLDLVVTDDPEETYRDMIGFLRSVEGDGKMESELMSWAYSVTQNDVFLSDEAKELFLF
jgi:hypothetical protein